MNGAKIFGAAFSHFELINKLNNRPFHNFEKGTVESGTHSDSLGNGRDQGNLVLAALGCICLQTRVIFDLFALLECYTTIVYHDKCFLRIIQRSGHPFNHWYILSHYEGSCGVRNS